MASETDVARAVRSWRHRRPRWSRRQSAGALLALSLAAAWLYGHRQEAARPAPEVLAAGTYRVARVVDGDTLQLENQARVRLLAVNAPESVRPESPVEPWGPQASAFTRGLVEGRDVRLEFDKERVDQYGRFLAYVWYQDASGPEKLLNEELVRAGLALTTPQYDNAAAMERRLRASEAEARGARRGIWSHPAGRLEREHVVLPRR